MDLVVVGSGLFGLTVAERAASAGKNVLILEKRDHFGGNAFSEINLDTGIEVHTYGSHIFHTSNEKVWEYVNRFTSFNKYEHRVFSNFKEEIYSLPTNLGTINQFFRAALGPSDAKKLISDFASEFEVNNAKNLHEKAISLIGRPLYEAFIEGYTQKQWGRSPKDLPPSIITRLPVRYTYDSRYFSDSYEGIPTKGYSTWFERMLDNDKIEIRLNTDFFDKSQPANKDSLLGQVPVVYTGPIDKYFDYRFGLLNWRTLDFETSVLEVQDFQGTSVINFPDAKIPFTRIHEFKHFHPERKDQISLEKTVIMHEFSRSAGKDDEPYYPVNSESDREILQKYRDLSKQEKLVYFGGRLGSYQYLDMHMAIASALVLSEKIINE